MLAVRLDTVANRDLEFRNIEEFALFDLLTANNDHHFKNILLKKVTGVEHIEGKIKTLQERFERIKLLANQKASLWAIAKDVLTLTCRE